MSTKRKRLARGIAAPDFAARAAELATALRAGGLDASVQLTYKHPEADAILALEAFTKPRAPHFMLQGELIPQEALSAMFLNAGALATANFEHAWGSRLLSLGRDQHGLRAVNFSNVVRPRMVAPSFVEEHLGALARSAGAEVQPGTGSLRLKDGVNLEIWTGPLERLYLKEATPENSLVDQVVTAIFGGITEPRRVLGSMKSWVSDFRGWLARRTVIPAAELEPYAGYAMEIGDWKSNVEEESLPGLIAEIEKELASSIGVLQLVVLGDERGEPVPVAAAQFGWTKRDTEVVWAPIGQDPTLLKRAWAIIEGVGSF